MFECYHAECCGVVCVMYKLRFCTSCNLYNSAVQVALAVQVTTCTEFDSEIISSSTRGLYKLDLMIMVN